MNFRIEQFFQLPHIVTGNVVSDNDGLVPIVIRDLTADVSLIRRQILYAFTVLIFLLRPFFAYAVSVSPQFAHQPAKSSIFLQRIFKKKDQHFEDMSEAAELVRSEADHIVIPLLLIFSSKRMAAWFFSFLTSSFQTLLRTASFKPCPADPCRLLFELQV